MGMRCWELGVHPVPAGSPTWGEMGCFWHAFPGTGREDAPVHTNLKMVATGFSPEPNETLGDPNGAFLSWTLAAGF